MDSPEARQGRIVETTDFSRLSAAVEMAMAYRGDVTITRHSSAEPVVGYVFDRSLREDAGSSVLRVIPVDAHAPLTIPGNDILRIELSGRDTAAGRSFETWIGKYVQRKLAGEEASIEAEPLEEQED